MACCDNPRMCYVNAKCSDLFSARLEDCEHEGYVPSDLGIGGGDYVKFKYCLNCGCIQGTWPLAETKLESGSEADDQPCDACGGSGICDDCEGEGEDDGETCESCDGSGKCSECDGALN